MGLIERLTNEEEPGLDAHAFYAALMQREIDKMTETEIVTGFGLSAAEQTEMNTLSGKIRGIQEVYPISGLITLTNIPTTYDASVTTKGLGFIRLEGLGITGADLTIRFNRTSSGNIDFQLWNETGTNEIMAVSDNTGNGDTELNASTTVSPLSAGIRTIRIRCKSTGGTADITYYGASVRIHRADAIYADVLHRILLLGKPKIAPYNTAALVRTALGL